MSKSTISVFILFLLFYTAYAQYGDLTRLIGKVPYAVHKGDTIHLILEGNFPDSVQWQSSIDSSNWKDIKNGNTSAFTVVVDSPATGVRYYRAAITDTSCKLTPVTYSRVIEAKIIGKSIPEGYWYNGGYYSGSNKVMSLTKTQSDEWGCYNPWANPSFPTVGTYSTNGKANTSDIVTYCGNNTAAYICSKESSNSYNDWFLPSESELKDIIGNTRNHQFGFTEYWNTNAEYWTSNDVDAEYARMLGFKYVSSNFYQYSVNDRYKYSNGIARCVRNTLWSEKTKPITIRLQYKKLIPVQITYTSASTEVCKDGNFDASLILKGTQPFSFQWKFEGKELAGETDSTFEINSAQILDHGHYYCEVTNACNQVFSDSIKLTVNGLSVDNIKPGNVQLNWNKKPNTNYIIFAKQTTTGMPVPSNGTTYNADAFFGDGNQIGSSGWYAVYNGSGQTVNLTGLATLSNYRVALYTYTGTSGNEVYTAVCNIESFSTPDYTTPSTQAADLEFKNIQHNSMDIKWTRGDGEYSIVFLRESSSGTVTLMDKTTYLANNEYGLGTQLGVSGWYCVYKGDSNASMVSGLNPNTTYRAMVISYNGVDGSERYLNTTANNNPANATTTFAPPSIQAAEVTFSDVTTSSFKVSWTNGNGDGRAVFVSNTSSGTASPENGTTYTANTNFGQGDQVGGTGWYCVYYGTGNTVTVKNLNIYNTYRVMVCEFNGTAGKESYNINPASNNPNNQEISDPVPSKQAKGIIVSNIYPFSFSATWTPGDGNKRAVFLSKTSVGYAAPVLNTTYYADTVFGSGSQIGTTGWYCVYNGTGNQVNISGLEYKETYRIMVCEYNGDTGKEQYNTSSAASNPFNTATTFEEPQMCIVTVDTISWKNKIVWAKPKPQWPVSGFKIYKEISTDFYSEIGSVPYNDPSFFVDVNSQPEAHGDKYKIAFYDNTGETSVKSKYHKTMNLTISSSGNTMGLRWDQYEDESGKYTPSKYFIFRGTTPDNMQLIDSVSGSFNSYNDVNVFSVYYYMIGVIKAGGCDDYFRSRENMSFSNKKDNSSLIGIPEDRKDDSYSLAPNPMQNEAILSFDNPANDIYHFSLYDSRGKQVRNYGSVVDNKIIIKRDELPAGVYMFTLKGSQFISGKLIIK